MKSILSATALAAVAALSGGGIASAGAPRTCVVPKLFALTVPAAQVRLAASGCRLGGIAFERPHTRSGRVTSQVPAPGAILPLHADVVFSVS